jgi:cell fate regulator YaaT (PSP1 superfamily)
MSVSVNDKDENGVKTRPAVGVRFKPCGKIYSFDPGELELKKGDKVVVESMFGLTIGTVVQEVSENAQAQKGDSRDEESERKGPAAKPPKELKPVVRKSTEEDLKAAESNSELEVEARHHCLERIAARGLPMKLVSTEATLDRKRVIFYFTADGRIDFRELVKDLASRFRTRIEMRQIGVRDESKLIGGIGVCGREFCCRSFLTSFAPISIRMAKEQELVLNAVKLSGVCGRLMCCLSYEYDEWQAEGLDEVVPEDPMNGCLCGDCNSESSETLVSSLTQGDNAPASVKKREESRSARDKASAGGGFKERKRPARQRRPASNERDSAGSDRSSDAEAGPPETVAGDKISADISGSAEKGDIETKQPDASQEDKTGTGKKKRPYFRHKNKKRRKHR